MLRLKKVSFHYGNNQVLHELEGASDSRAIAILGENGAGKSTLLRLLAGLTRPSAGSFVLGAWDNARMRNVRQRRADIGVVPQSVELSSGYTPSDLLRYCCWLKAVPLKKVESEITKSLSEFDLVEQRDQKISRLSGGMRQRLCLAQASLGGPSVVILDEPTVGLDPRQRADVRAHLQSLAERTTIILATHLIEDVAVLAEDVLVLHEGRIAFLGSLQGLCAQGSVQFSPGQTPTGPMIEEAYLNVTANRVT